MLERDAAIAWRVPRRRSICLEVRHVKPSAHVEVTQRRTVVEFRQTIRWLVD